MIERMEFSSDITKLRNDDQYLVTLNILSNLKALNTDRPNDPPFTSDQTTSNIDPLITTQSKRLKDDSKYIRGPSAYILIHISIINIHKNTYSA